MNYMSNIQITIKRNLRLKNLFLLVFISLLFACKSEKVLAPEPVYNFTKLDSTITSLYNNSEIPGFSLVVVNNEKIIFQKSLGYADISTQKSFTNNTLQNIGSVSKTFIALAVMKAVDLRKVKLDENINTYLPFKIVHPLFPDSAITLRNLSNHTAGINDGDIYFKSYIVDNPSQNHPLLPAEVQEYFSFMKLNKDIDDSEFLKNILVKKEIWYSEDNFTKDAPGEKFEYSNIGATLAAFVIESAMGITYEDFTKQYIISPLQMNQTGWESSQINSANFVTRYFSKELIVPDYHLITKADGGLLTSTTDFGKYLIEILNGVNGNGTLLTKNSYKEMFTKKVIGERSFGIFWSIEDNGNLTHDGSDPGIAANCIIKKDKNIAYFLMTNISSEISQVHVPALLEISKKLDEI